MPRFFARRSPINVLQLFFELIIVFIGVYLAFLLANHQQERQARQERERVIGLVRLGLERYESLFAGFVQGHASRNATFRAALEAGEVPDFGGDYFPAPQYPIDVINHILTSESYAVLAQDLYVPLAAYVNAIQRMMYIEEKLAQLADRYEPLPIPPAEDAFLRQRHLAIRYYGYLERRKSTAEELATRSTELIARFDALN